nr:MAG TPA: hypothetical protein [Caudoviricetes sp.]
MEDYKTCGKILFCPGNKRKLVVNHRLVSKLLIKRSKEGTSPSFFI